MKHTYLGIDLGTSAVKVLLINDRKQIIKQINREYEIDHPSPGWSEIDPRVWYDHLLECLHEMFEDQDAGMVGGIGVTGQMHTTVTIDINGEPVRKAIMWNDTRTKALLPFLKETLAGFPEGRYLSGIVSTGSPAANLYWMSRMEPEHFSKIWKFMIGPDYIVYRLTGNVGTDYCEASTSSMYRIHDRKWSGEVRDLIQLPEERYPAIHGSAQITGYILPALCSEIGFSEQTPVIAGTGDNPASAVSTGCFGGHYPVLSLGTSGVLMKPLNSVDNLAKGKVILFSDDGERVFCLVQGVVQSTGECVNWWAKKILGRDELDRLTEQFSYRCAKDSAEKKPFENILFYPHINGDKTIYADPDLRGAFIGLSTDTTAEDMFYAVIEGLSFAFRQLAEEMGETFDSGFLKVIGGGSANDIWMQTLADVLNVHIERMQGAFGAGFGIALLAMACMREDVSMDNITTGILQTDKVFYPDQRSVANLQLKYKKYLKIHDAVKNVMIGP